MKQSLSANICCAPPKRQHGAALITALIFLIIITVIALSSMRSSTQELRMALNAEEKLTAAQLAQAVADSLWLNPNATPVIGEVGRRVCTSPVPTSVAGCDDATLVLPAEITQMLPATGQAFVAVERLNPETRPCPGFTIANELGGFGCAAFRVHARYDGTAVRGGRADVYEGVLVLTTSN
jgi:hypothetical protein